MAFDVLTLTISVLTPLEQAISLVLYFKQQKRIYGTNAEHIDRISSLYADLQKRLHAISSQFQTVVSKPQLLQSSDLSEYYSYMNNMRESFLSANQVLSDIRKSQIQDGWFVQFLQAHSIKSKWQQLEQTAYLAHQRIDSWHAFLSTVSAVGTDISQRLQPIETVLHDINRAVSPLENPVTFKPSFFKETPPHFVRHHFETAADTPGPETHEAKLKRIVLRENHPNGRPVTAVVGMSGAGKSCALRGLAEQKDVISRFPGGVYFMSLGAEAKRRRAIEKLGDMVEYSGGRLRARDVRLEMNLDVAVARTADWFQERACLFIVDDVAVVNDIGADFISVLAGLLRCSQQSALVFSTRDTDVGSLATEILDFSPRDPLGDESRGILLRSARVEKDVILDGDEEFKACVDELLRFCAGLPLALAVVGNAVFKRRKRSKKGESSVLKSFVVTLEDFAQGAIQEGFDNHPGLYAAFSASLQVLSDEVTANILGFPLPMPLHRMYRALCIVQRQGWLPDYILARLWGVGKSNRALKIAELFADASLAEVEEREAGGMIVSGIRLHDWMHIYCSTKASQCEGGVQFWHKQLLNTYIEPLENSWGGQQSIREWWMIEDDLYILGELSRHLVGAGLRKELENLVLNPLWTRRLLQDHRTFQLQKDVTILVDSIRRAEEQLTSEHKRLIKGMDLIIKAIHLSWGYYSQNPEELWFQLTGRLTNMMDKYPVIRMYLSNIEQLARAPWAKPILGSLHPPGGRLRSTIDMFRQTENGPHGILNGIVGSLAYGKQRKDFQNDVFMTDAVRQITQMQRAAWQEQKSVSGMINANRITLSANGRRAVVDLGFGDARVMDSRTGELLTSKLQDEVPEKFDDWWSCCAISAEGDVAAINFSDSLVNIWNVEKQRLICTLRHGHDIRVEGLAMSGDGEHVVTRCNDGSVLLWNAISGKQHKSISHGHSGTVTCVAISSDGSLVATGSSDSTARLFDISQDSSMATVLRGHNYTVRDIAMTTNSSRLATISDDGTARVWNASGELVCDPIFFEGDTFWKTFVGITDDGSQILTGTAPGPVQVWSVDYDASSLDTSQRWINQVSRCVVCCDGNRIISVSENGLLHAWDTSDGSRVCQIDNAIMPKIVEAAPDGSRIATSSGEDVHIWDGNTGELISSISHKHVTCVTIPSIQGQVAIGTRIGTAQVWNYHNGKPSSEVFKHGSSITSMSITPRADRLVTLCREEHLQNDGGNVRVWDVRKCKVQHQVQSLLPVAISEDGKILASREYRWDLTTKALEAEKRGIQLSGFATEEIVDIERQSMSAEDMKMALLRCTQSGICIDGSGYKHLKDQEDVKLATFEDVEEVLCKSFKSRVIGVALRGGEFSLILVML